MINSSKAIITYCVKECAADNTGDHALHDEETAASVETFQADQIGFRAEM